MSPVPRRNLIQKNLIQTFIIVQYSNMHVACKDEIFSEDKIYIKIFFKKFCRYNFFTEEKSCFFSFLKNCINRNSLKNLPIYYLN